MSYPKWKYHRSEPARTIHSEEEEAALGDSWAESPTAFEAEEPADMHKHPEHSEPEEIPAEEIKEEIEEPQASHEEAEEPKAEIPAAPKKRGRPKKAE